MINSLIYATMIISIPSVCFSADPIGYTIFCMNNKSFCRSFANTSIKLNPEMVQKIDRVNVNVNRSIRPKADKTEEWTLNPNSGDCEDYVLTKKYRLLKSGVPGGSMHIATTYSRGVKHAVLLVDTDKGFLVLDNLTNKVKFKTETSYVFDWIEK